MGAIVVKHVIEQMAALAKNAVGDGVRANATHHWLGGFKK